MRISISTEEKLNDTFRKQYQKAMSDMVEFSMNLESDEKKLQIEVKETKSKFDAAVEKLEGLQPKKKQLAAMKAEVARLEKLAAQETANENNALLSFTKEAKFQVEQRDEPDRTFKTLAGAMNAPLANRPAYMYKLGSTGRKYHVMTYTKTDPQTGEKVKKPRWFYVSPEAKRKAQAK